MVQDQGLPVGSLQELNKLGPEAGLEASCSVCQRGPSRRPTGMGMKPEARSAAATLGQGLGPSQGEGNPEGLSRDRQGYCSCQGHHIPLRILFVNCHC